MAGILDLLPPNAPIEQSAQSPSLNYLLQLIMAQQPQAQQVQSQQQQAPPLAQSPDPANDEAARQALYHHGVNQLKYVDWFGLPWLLKDAQRRRMEQINNAVPR